ncbi:AcrB/AcrD/AcrF family protein [Sphingomonas glaciei]|uniref:AcrB/AcrD/AcrF family protein n=1 Tax=Sphingomonas glaciei TaxID=2938948 RepID=A0ABY5MVQ2_9SPHN|nr:AcrB/AcrD/AcrF family protein [Sphingomonas glaciei]UUR07534.1 AcrB/AcrD/AcrF family protein [Sphingomonas glaciei]
MPERLLGWMERHWRLVILVVWLLACALFTWQKWGGIVGFALGDTDDNLRMAQVRALLNGQGWFDLRQYRFDPAFGGANIHWSRIVDLPIAGLILLGKLFTTGAEAERMAVAVAPMLPYAVLLTGIALTARRLISPAAFVAAFIALYFGGATNGMFMPTRIDHHGWQLAMLSLVIAGLADPDRRRGGLTVGIASAVSLAIGLEMLIYLALAAAAQVLMWVSDEAERDRMLAYAVSIAGGTAIGFLLFASYANRAAVCDALSPVWLSDTLLGGALLTLIVWKSPDRWTTRLALAAGAGVAVAAFHALAWPHCLSRLEGVSPEVDRLWLSNVREAKPITQHSWRTVVTVISLPVAGLFGWAWLAWLHRREPELLRRILGPAAIAAAALALLFWQTRAGPASQLLGVVGCAALTATLLPRLWNAKNSLVVVLGSTALVLAASGGAAPLFLKAFPEKPEKITESQRLNNRANRLCPTLWAMRPVARQPKGMVFTFIDLGPRLIAVTKHDALGGPYHRNGMAIADSMNAMRGSPEQARALILKHRSDYLLVCPHMNQATIFRAQAPRGFYSQLERGAQFPWLQPIDLGKDSPLKMWRVMR